jgi:hypothetical protein
MVAPIIVKLRGWLGELGCGQQISRDAAAYTAIACSNPTRVFGE